MHQDSQGDKHGAVHPSDERYRQGDDPVVTGYQGKAGGWAGVLSGPIDHFAPNTLCKSSVVRLAGFWRIAASSLAI